MTMMLPFILSFKLAIITTAALLILGVPVGTWIAYTKSRLTAVADIAINLLLVLPPSVIGFYLLLLFSPSCGVGKMMKEYFHCEILFTFTGLLIGAVLFSLPFMVNAVKTGLRAVPRQLIEASYTLGKGKVYTFFAVILPNAWTAVMSGAIVCFVHTIGAFGIMLMVGGNIPGKTRVASIALYHEVETLHYAAAHGYSVLLIGITVCALLVLRRVQDRSSRRAVCQ